MDNEERPLVDLETSFNGFIKIIQAKHFVPIVTMGVMFSVMLATFILSLVLTHEWEWALVITCLVLWLIFFYYIEIQSTGLGNEPAKYRAETMKQLYCQLFFYYYRRVHAIIVAYGLIVASIMWLIGWEARITGMLLTDVLVCHAPIILLLTVFPNRKRGKKKLTWA